MGNNEGLLDLHPTYDSENRILSEKPDVDHPEKFLSNAHDTERNMTRIVHDMEEQEETNTVNEKFPGREDHPSEEVSDPASELQTYMSGDAVVASIRDDIRMNDGSTSQHDLVSGVTDTDLFELGVDRLRQFERFGDIQDVQQAILSLERSVRSTSPGEQLYLASSTNLGVAFTYRYRYLGVLGDLDSAVMWMRKVVELTPDQHYDKPGRLTNLGTALMTRFNHLGEVSDLQNGILRLSYAAELAPNQHPDKPSCLSNLGTALRTRFNLLGEVNDLHDAVSRLKNAVELTPNHCPGKPAYLNSLGSALRTRFDCLGKICDLRDAISRYRDAVELTPDHHPDKPGCLSNLGSALSVRFERLGEVGDLQEGISKQVEAVELTPTQHSDKPLRLSNLGKALLTRFEHLGEFSDLRDAISRLSDAVELTPNQHPNKSGRLNSLGTALRNRFDHLREVDDLQDAISRHTDAVNLTPDEHPEKPSYLSNLGTALRTRFHHLGRVKDLQDAISRHKDAVELTPSQHPGKSAYLSNLGNALWTRFEYLGEISDIQDAVLRHRGAVDLTPDHHPDKPGRLNNLGTSLRTRFGLLREISDLQNAISSHRDAVELIPNHHPDKPTCLESLGTALQTRFKHLEEVSDLQEAILRYRDAVNLTPNHSPTKSRHLSNLGTALQCRFDHLGEISDLQDAISEYRDALKLNPDNQHPDKPNYLSNLGTALRTRFERLGDIKDLQNAISRFRDAVEFTPNQHPGKAAHLIKLGNVLLIRFQHLGDVGDLEEAISHFSCSANALTAPATIRLRACNRWVVCARLLGYSLFDAYSVAISLLPRLAWAGLSLTDRYRELIEGAGVVREAAAAALDSHLPKTAVEWLEQGRSIVWGDLYQLRSSYDELLHTHPDQAHRLRQLSAELEHAGVAREKSIALLSELERMLHAGDAVKDSLQKQADLQRDVAIERDKLLQEIRKFPGFERFLLQKEFSRLRASAHSGPVVILNAAECRCDALIILAGKDEPIHVPFCELSLVRSTGLQKTLKELVDRYRDVLCEERKGMPKSEWKSHQWISILSVLWNNVVKPVLDALAFSTPGDFSRIFWCPTGPFTFLPIHAAGLYGIQYSEPGHKVSDFVVSSYIPTLSTLMPSPERDTTTRDNVRLLAVPQPASDGHSPLPGVVLELQHIRTAIKSCPSGRISLMESCAGTVEEVLSLMKDSDWVHFACHGVQDVHNPAASGLCLAKGHRLKVSDIVSLSRPRGGLAFLSACQTATGDKELSDEAIHIAAGMLFAGYGGVVGSMWAINDRLAPEVAREVYDQVFQDSAAPVPDPRNAARALHNAIARLRERGESFSGWLPFIHVGL